MSKKDNKYIENLTIVKPHSEYHGITYTGDDPIDRYPDSHPPTRFDDFFNPCGGPHYHYHNTIDIQPIITLLTDILTEIKKINNRKVIKK